MVGKFVSHEPCPECGSKDNLARYADGGAYCFGCKHYEAPSAANFSPHRAGILDEDGGKISNYRDTISTMEANTIPELGLLWLGKYGFTAEDAIRYKWLWNPRSKQLLFPLDDEWGDPVCIQARNFDPERASEAKYFNWGNRSKHFNIYKSTVWWMEDSVVLTEDVLSSAKISKAGVDAYPLLGTTITKERLNLLCAYYHELYVWLDHDKFKEALDIKEQARLLGMKAHVILTTEDPKCYNTEEIRGYIRSLHD